MKFKEFALALFLSTCSFSPAMSQQSQCAPRDNVIQYLEGEFGEGRIGLGLAGTQIVELFTNPDTGSWTIIVSFPNGQSCLLASGSDYTTVKPDAKGVDG